MFDPGPPTSEGIRLPAVCSYMFWEIQVGEQDMWEAKEVEQLKERKPTSWGNTKLWALKDWLNCNGKGINLFWEASGVLSRSYRETDFGPSKGEPRFLERWKGLLRGRTLSKAWDKDRTGVGSLDSELTGWCTVGGIYVPVHSESPVREHYHCVFPYGPIVTFTYKNSQTFPGRPSIWRWLCFY